MNSFDSVECMSHILMNEGVEDEEVLKNTPERWVEAFRAMLGSGHGEWDFTTFETTADGLVTCGPIQFASLCSHHLLPFYGEAYVGYIPQGHMAGLSKLARAVRTAALGLWSQEELCEEIMHQLVRRLSHTEHREVTPNGIYAGDPGFREKTTKPKGVAVVMRAEHTCMTVRGVKAPGAITTTSSMDGVFRDNDNIARAEFQSWIMWGGK